MNRSTALVSVIIPTYNRAAFLAEAVGSVLRQAYRPLEVIIVDDGSTDETAHVVAQFGSQVRYQYQPNRGPAAARNHGLRLAGGELIGFLDSDDWWPDDALDLQLDLLSKNPSVEIVSGHAVQVRREPGAPEIEVISPPQFTMNLSCTLFRRSAFDRTGGFDEKLWHCDDWDLFMRVRELGLPMLIHDSVVHFYRRHESNITNQRSVSQQYQVKMLRQSLARRRALSNGQAESLPSFGVNSEIINSRR